MALLGVLLSASVVAAAPTAKVLPLRKLRLYETGVGYFERRGAVKAGADLALALPAAHVDDALKSIVVLESKGAIRIEGIELATSVSQGMARAMAGLPEEADTQLGYQDLLRSLTGARVEVRTDGRRVAGRLVDVEGPIAHPPAKKEDADEEPARPPRFMLLLLGDDDAVRRIDTDLVESLKVLDRGTATRLDIAAAALSDQSARRVQEVRVQTDAGGQLGLGYIAEAPVWRTTYRVVLGLDDDRGQLQGWALVHNDTDEDWRDVGVEMVNGRPASFLHPLAAPRYAHRELLEPPDALSTVPQLANTTPDRMWLDGGEIGESFGAGGLGLTGTGRGGGGTAEGVVGVGIVGPGDGSLGDLAELAQATGEDSGALFIYRVRDPIDLDAHHSALLPIVQQEIEVESITWFGVDEDDGLSAARLVNSTDQTLPLGTISFFADGGFVGESMIDRLKPGERRFVAYGSELDVDLVTGREPVGEQTTAVVHHKGKLLERFVQTSKITLAIHNRSGRIQRVYVGLPVSRYAKLEGDGKVELDFDLATDTPLAATRVTAGQEVAHTLVAKTAERRWHKTTTKALTALVRRDGLSEQTRSTLRAALEHLRRADALRADEALARSEIRRAKTDLARLRRNLEAVGRANPRRRLENALTRRLLAEEARIEALRARIDDAHEAAAAARERATDRLRTLQ